MIHLHTCGSHVPSSTVLTVEYHDPPLDRWSRILRLVAIVTLIYGAANIGLAIFTARTLWPFKRVPSIAARPGEYWLWAISFLITFVIAAALITGATICLKGGKYRLIVWGSWSLLVLWPIGVVITWVANPGRLSMSMFISTVFYGAEIYIFPLLVILVLRAHRLRYAHASTTRFAH